MKTPFWNNIHILGFLYFFCLPLPFLMLARSFQTNFPSIQFLKSTLLSFRLFTYFLLFLFLFSFSCICLSVLTLALFWYVLLCFSPVFVLCLVLLSQTVKQTLNPLHFYSF